MLTLLAPDIVEPILGGWVAAGGSAARGPNAAVSSRVAEQRIDMLSSVSISACQVSTSFPLSARATRPITFVRALIRCEPRRGRSPVGGRSQVLGHQQECRKDQGVHNCDRDHANGKTAVVVIKVRPQNIAKSRCDEK